LKGILKTLGGLALGVVIIVAIASLAMMLIRGGVWMSVKRKRSIFHTLP
jgi:hypothetical protein